MEVAGSGLAPSETRVCGGGSGLAPNVGFAFLAEDDEPVPVVMEVVPPHGGLRLRVSGRRRRTGSGTVGSQGIGFFAVASNFFGSGDGILAPSTPSMVPMVIPSVRNKN